ncbi:MAG: T9SS type A sorting domain-containing protein [Bacteroidales bacterium]|nr:T9SS type A sorting domain-containing protein [Bacteroidales bacterium]
MRLLKLTMAGFILSTWYSHAQMDTVRYLESGFETLADQQQWTSLPADNQKKWIFQKGGLDGYNPDTAYSGNYNALYYWGDPQPYPRMLVSQPIDLSDASRPELSFGYAMLPDFFGLHHLSLLFKAGASAPWDTIATYTTEADWTLRTFNIKDYGAKYLCEDFQVAFLGTSGGGHGVCVDQVIIEEKDAIVRYVKSVGASHVGHDVVPSGAVDIPVMRVDVVIVGNTDQTVLNSVSFTSMNVDDDLFGANAFELVATPDSIYRPTSESGSLKIGTAVSVAGGEIVFDNLNCELATGLNSIWLIADIKGTAPHDSPMDFRLESHAVEVNASTYPAVEYSPPGFNIIEHSILFEGFEGTGSWVVQNDFEMAAPQGYVAHITTDPDFAYSGNRILGTDLTVDGRYLLNITSANAYYATSPVINLKYYDDVKLTFKKWNAFEGNDHAVIEVSIDTGDTWYRLWDSKIDALTPDYQWNDLTFAQEFDEIASRQPWVQVRFGVIFSDNSFAYAGFNIDNFAVTGKYLTNDVGIVSMTAPVDDCHNPGMDSVEIVVRNFADGETAASIPVFFSMDGSETLKVYDHITGPIPRDGSVTFRFAQAAEFPEAGVYGDFTAGIEMDGDEDPDNDIVVKSVFIQESITPPHLQTFETGDGYWKIYGTDPTWMCKSPEGSIPALPGSLKSWILSPFGNYLTSDTSFAESSCYDMVPLGRAVLEMDLWIDSESGKDGACIELSTDEGESWILVDANEYGWDWNWYNTTVAALGTAGWSEINTSGWKTVRQVLPESLLLENKVKFRIKWASDEDNTYRGMAFDNFTLYSAPPDIGVVAVDSFASRCQYLNPGLVEVTIENLGINPMSAGDTVVLGFDFNGSPLDRDTILLADDLLPGQTLEHAFDAMVDVSMPGIYNITAYTLTEDDPYFYLSNNDTLSLDFEVYANPVVTMLGDTIQTQIPDTVQLRPYYDPDYDYYWDYDGSTSAVFAVPEEGMYRVKVTDARGNGCAADDSSYVELLFNDVGVDSLLYPIDHCGLGTSEYLVIRVRNFGTDSIVSGSRIAVAYEMNEGLPVRDTIEVVETLPAGDAVDHTFATGSDLTAPGIYHFRVYSDFEGDTVLSNDVVEKDVEMYGYPTVDIGQDITIQALTYELDAGAGYTGYLWSSGTTEQTFEVTSTGTYWVRVTDENQCEGYDTATIRLKIRDLSPAAFSGPLSGCQWEGAEPVILQLWNTGTDTIPAGQDIDVTYILDEGPVVEELLTLDSELLPEHYVEHVFTGEVDVSQEGDYGFVATAKMTGDIRTFNDTLRLTVFRYSAPAVDFGLEEVEYAEDIEFVIDAGYSPHYIYDWQDDSANHTYTAVTSGTYHVIVTDTRTACYDGDTVMLFLIYNNVGVTYTDMPVEGCSGEYDNITVRITNLGTTNIGSVVPIYVRCNINGSVVFTEEVERTANFAPGTGIDLELTNAVLVEEEGISRISFSTLYDEDMKPWDDTLLVEFDGLLSPDIDFGEVNGILNVGLPHDLDAGGGHKSYLWQDGYTGQIYTAVESGTYSVAVTGQNDCVAEKSVRINPGTVIEHHTGLIREIRIFPNPGDGNFILEVDAEMAEDLTMQVYDSGGQLVYSHPLGKGEQIREQINLMHLSHGIYHILITGDNPVYQGKLIIQ